MPRIFQADDSGMLTELPSDTDYLSLLHRRELMVEAVVLYSPKEIAEHEEMAARAKAEGAKAEAERAAIRERRREARMKVSDATGLSMDELREALGND